ncbi:tRNA pseudouridine(55) synthase TruB [Mangrovitalea sediminis]|uniref:tRNA pseudouridine(55) synthase TruB n=1 Tax=Mangrovitalea sediminis TaxID=1982043 RepID=UPI000BE541A2|nr:tRNA pseudouridine(55) synthase TruB [Mangrovitalea sediminis]
MRRRKGRRLDGILVVDKPQGLTSNGVLQRVKRCLDAAKAGHTGSLDPLATGVLPICLGEATKFSQYLLDADKAYVARARLGQVTSTGDSEGEIIRERPLPESLDEAQLEEVLAQFRGEIDQVPPMYSALKHQGRPLYELARQGVEVERKARRVTIYELTLLSLAADGFEIAVRCSKGTYIRSLVQDIGEALGCGAHLTALRRTMAAGFTEAVAVSLEQLQEEPPEVREGRLMPVDTALKALPQIVLNPEHLVSILNGQPVRIDGCPVPGPVRLYGADRFVGLGEYLADGRVQPRRLIQSSP